MPSQIFRASTEPKITDPNRFRKLIETFVITGRANRDVVGGIGFALRSPFTNRSALNSDLICHYHHFLSIILKSNFPCFRNRFDVCKRSYTCCSDWKNSFFVLNLGLWHVAVTLLMYIVEFFFFFVLLNSWNTFVSRMRTAHVRRT